MMEVLVGKRLEGRPRQTRKKAAGGRDSETVGDSTDAGERGDAKEREKKVKQDRKRKRNEEVKGSEGREASLARVGEFFLLFLWPPPSSRSITWLDGFIYSLSLHLCFS